MMRQLEGKGRMTYDYEYDILYFRIEERDYDVSEEFDDIIFDLDKEEFIIGISIQDASKHLKVPKEALRSIKDFEFSALVEGKVATVQLRFTCINRNKELRLGQDFVRELDIREGKTLART